MLVVARLRDDAVCPGDPRRPGHADRVADAARTLSAIACDHHLVVVSGGAGRPTLPGLEQALACRQPADRLATVPIRVEIGAADAAEPRSIVELRTLRILVDRGVAVICPADACIPVLRTQAGALRAVEAAIDGDVLTRRLAVELDADALLLLTSGDADRGAINGTGPNVEAVRDFVEAGGWLGAVGPLSKAAEMLRSGPGVVDWGGQRQRHDVVHQP